MKVHLDECVPRKLKNSLMEHECQTVSQAGFTGKKNGEMLSLAERERFDVVLTMDKGVAYQQNLAGRKIAIIIIHAKSNRLKDLLPHGPSCLTSIESIQPGQIVNIG